MRVVGYRVAIIGGPQWPANFSSLSTDDIYVRPLGRVVVMTTYGIATMRSIIVQNFMKFYFLVVILLFSRGQLDLVIFSQSIPDLKNGVWSKKNFFLCKNENSECVLPSQKLKSLVYYFWKR